MKNLVFVSFLTALSLNAFAAANIEGHCVVTSNQFPGVRDYAFSVAPGEKAELGILVDTAGKNETPYNVYSVEVVNNAGTSLQNTWGGIVLALSRPKETFYFKNPPTLCPSAPKEERDKCVSKNSLIPAAATDAFHLVSGHNQSDFALPAVIEVNPALGYQTALQYNFVSAQVSCVATYGTVFAEAPASHWTALMKKTMAGNYTCTPTSCVDSDPVLPTVNCKNLRELTFAYSAASAPNSAREGYVWFSYDADGPTVDDWSLARSYTIDGVLDMPGFTGTGAFKSTRMGSNGLVAAQSMKIDFVKPSTPSARMTIDFGGHSAMTADLKCCAANIECRDDQYQN